MPQFSFSKNANTVRSHILPVASLSLALSFSLYSSAQAETRPGSEATTGSVPLIINSALTSGLDVPADTTVLVDFGTLGNNKGSSGILNITGGALVNHGNMYLYSSNPQITKGVMNLGGGDFTNNSLITSKNIPTDVLLNNNLSNLVSNFNLSFINVNHFTNAANAVISSAGSMCINAADITNNGTLSANSMNLTALNFINNTGTAQANLAMALSAPQVSNSGSLLANSLTITTANIINSGLLEASELRILSGVTDAIQLNNNNGHIDISGAVQIIAGSGSPPSSLIGSVLNISGGIIDSNSISIIAAGGTAKIAVDSLAGKVSLIAQTINLTANSGNITIQSINNISSESKAPSTSPSVNVVVNDGDLNLGTIFFSGSNYSPDYITNGSISAVASGSIYSTASTQKAGSSISTNGGVVTLKAGWDSKAGAASKSGGDINLGHLSFATNGGDFKALAYSGDTNKGALSLGAVNSSKTAMSSSTQSSSGGNVEISASSDISTGAIFANATANNISGLTNTGNGGNILLSSLNGSIAVGDIASTGANSGSVMKAQNGGTTNTGGGIVSSGGGIVLGAGGSASGGTVTITSGVSLNSSGSSINLSGTVISIPTPGVSGGVSAPGNGGNITVNAPSGTVTAGNVASTGGSGNTSTTYFAGADGGRITILGRESKVSSVSSIGGTAGNSGSNPINSTSKGLPGGSAGDIVVSGARALQIGKVDSIGGNGGSCVNCASIILSTGNIGLTIPGRNSSASTWRGVGGSGGNGGDITLSSSLGELSLGGTVRSAGGQGGAGGASGGAGGDGGAITISSRGNISSSKAISIASTAGISGESKSGAVVAGSDGGNVSIYSVSNILLGSGSAISSNGYGKGAHSGNISLTARGGIRYYFPELRGAKTIYGAAATDDNAALVLTPIYMDPPIGRPNPYPPFFAGGQITVGKLDSSGHAGANGGNISVLSSTALIGDASNNVSIDSSSYSSVNSSTYGGGSAGNVHITTSSMAPFVIGSPTGNGSFGSILANGRTGGRVELENIGGQELQAGSGIYANGTFGAGGNVLFESGLRTYIYYPTATSAISRILPPFPVVITGMTLSSKIDGVVQATNVNGNSGRIGFNAGPKGILNISGKGKLNAGEFVSVGNLNSNLTLASSKSGKLNPVPFALSILHGSFKCNASNCGATSKPATPPSSSSLFVNLSNLNVPTIQLPTLNSGLPSTDSLNKTVNLISYPTNTTQVGTSLYLGAAEDEEKRSICVDVDNEFKPVSKSEIYVIAPPSMQRVESVTCNTRYFKGSAESQNGKLSLANGEYVLSANNGDLHVVAGAYQIDMKQDSVLFVHFENDLIKVLNLHETSLGSVSIQFGGRLSKIAAGQELIVSKNASDSRLSMRRDGIGRRGTVHTVLNNEGLHVTNSEFSIASLIQANDLMHHVYQSKEKKDRRDIARILKMHACLHQLTLSRGVYKLAQP